MGMKNLLQNITNIKNEPIVEEHLDVKPISFKTEPVDQEVEKQNLTRPSEFEASPDKNSMTRKISQSVENMSDNPMKPADDKIFEKNEDPDMADESDFIKELEANELNNIIKEFEDEELKRKSGKLKQPGGKQ